MDIENLNMENLIHKTTPEMIPEAYRKYAKLIGVENFYKLTKLSGGRTIYLPRPSALFRDVRRQLVVQDYKSSGMTIEEIAEKYDLDRKTVWKYIKR